MTRGRSSASFVATIERPSTSRSIHAAVCTRGENEFPTLILAYFATLLMCEPNAKNWGTDVGTRTCHFGLEQDSNDNHMCTDVRYDGILIYIRVISDNAKSITEIYNFLVYFY